MEGKHIYINEIETYYVIYPNGTVFNERKNRFLTGRIINGYRMVHFKITDLGINEYRLVHVLVAKAFVPNPLNKPQVNHIDGNKLNNDVSNLEWVTARENTIHAYKHGLAKIRSGEDSGNVTHSNKEIERVCKLLASKKYTNKEISIMTGIAERLISAIRCGSLWKTISSKYPDIAKKEYRFVKFHDFVDYLIRSGNSTSYIIDKLIQKEGLSISEARNLLNTRRKAIAKKKLKVRFL